MKGRINTNIQRKKRSVLSVSVIQLFIQFTAMYWNITQNSRKCRSGLWVQGWSTNWILNWNDSSKQQSGLGCPPECKSLSKWYPGSGATLKTVVTIVHLKERLSVTARFARRRHYLQVKYIFPYDKTRLIGLFLSHFVSTKTGHKIWHKAY